MRIEKNIPIPQATHGAKASYPFRKMEVWDSFAAPADGLGANCKAAAAARTFAYRTGWKFTVRSIDGDKVRIWRIE